MGGRIPLRFSIFNLMVGCFSVDSINQEFRAEINKTVSDEIGKATLKAQDAAAKQSKSVLSALLSSKGAK